MKRTLVLAALAGLTLAPAAYPQVDCGEIRRIISEAENEFDDITGAKIEDDFYESRYLIGGSRECYVDLTAWPTYSCLFQHDRPDSAFSAYRYRLGEVRRCLSDWKQTDVPEQRPINDGYRDLEGVRFEGSGKYDGMDWLVLVEQHIQSGRAHYHVRIEFSYF